MCQRTVAVRHVHAANTLSAASTVAVKDATCDRKKHLLCQQLAANSQQYKLTPVHPVDNT